MKRMLTIIASHADKERTSPEVFRTNGSASLIVFTYVCFSFEGAPLNNLFKLLPDFGKIILKSAFIHVEVFIILT